MNPKTDLKLDNNLAAMETLKYILSHLHHPELLDEHAWTQKLIVQEALARDTSLLDKSPGQQLISAITELFSQLMPSSPPKRGLRLDTHWGEFGLLAAMYFAPLKFGAPAPASLRDAWGRIDGSIQLFVHAASAAPLSEKSISRYQLIRDEPETGPASTISDWHRRGVERLAEVISREEQRLAASKNTPQVQVRSGKPVLNRKWVQPARLWLGRFFLLAALVLLASGGWKVWRVYQRVQSIRQQAEALLAFSVSSFNAEQIESAGQHVSTLRTDMSALQKETLPFMGLAPYLGWIPTYGGDLTQAPALLEMGVQLSIAGEELFQAVAPILPDVMGDQFTTSMPALLSTLQNADSQLLAAQVALSKARTARQQVQSERLSERTGTLLQDKIDPLLLAIQGAFPADEVLQMARLAPRILGAVGNGPQTYLILIQNEDELRPTGGFLTAVGRVEVEDGQIRQINFEGASLVDDLSKPYPASPWQLDEYMRLELFFFRDANWFTNFPTTVEWTKFLYAYAQPGKIDGVIAIDQHVVVEILRKIGPIQVEGEAEPITSENVMQYMRLARSEGTPAGYTGQVWDRKQFISRMAEPMLKKLLARQEYSLPALLRALIGLLDERHILLQFDDPEMKALLASRNWDGVVRPPTDSDYLMVVDTNIGFNKTNLAVDSELAYQVDLRDLARPQAHLDVTYRNHVQEQIPCYQIPRTVGILIEQEYPYKDCYWTYLRVYTPAGSELLASTPRAVRQGLTLRESYVPARTDLLGDENIPGVAAYGTLVVVPTNESLQTSFDLDLPQSVLKQDSQSSTWRYHLKVQKQPGTLAVPLSLRISLPPGMQVREASHALQVDGETWLLETDLRQDLDFTVVLEANSD